jgi:hypothetical protein
MAGHDLLLPSLELDDALMLPARPMRGNKHVQCFDVLLISVDPILATANTPEVGITADIAVLA